MQGLGLLTAKGCPAEPIPDCFQPADKIPECKRRLILKARIARKQELASMCLAVGAGSKPPHLSTCSATWGIGALDIGRTERASVPQIHVSHFGRPPAAIKAASGLPAVGGHSPRRALEKAASNGDVGSPSPASRVLHVRGDASFHSCISENAHDANSSMVSSCSSIASLLSDSYDRPKLKTLLPEQCGRKALAPGLHFACVAQTSDLETQVAVGGPLLCCSKDTVLSSPAEFVTEPTQRPRLPNRQRFVTCFDTAAAVTEVPRLHPPMSLCAGTGEFYPPHRDVGCAVVAMPATPVRGWYRFSQTNVRDNPQENDASSHPVSSPLPSTP